MKPTIAEIVLDLIPDSRANAISSKDLMAFTGLTFRQLKVVIAELRVSHPICAKEIDGGGYWMAESYQDIQEYINMMSNRRDGYNRTINIMENHLFTEVV